ncbi:hypothetical protein [Mycobacterium sp. 1274756.6]|uniref:hypothetical protein n=1 Tax=Mycobacterium sp. 1274756.6 TaxID=1834076 RepID=UPI0007FF09B0|nr:hypothetical protein [Mycobacterium sp. 1274756.6]OBJ69149.1 hypothetical protein A5643_13075 [Mycobacterium sp. 1274756.6]
MTQFDPAAQIRPPGSELKSLQTTKWVILVTCGIPTIVGLLIGAVAAALSGRGGLAVLLVGGAVFFIVGLGATFVPSLFEPCWSVDGRGTVLRMPQGANTFGNLMISGFSMLGVGAGAVAFFDPGSLDFFSEDAGPLRAIGVFWALGAIGFWVFFVVQNNRRGGHHLLFTPEGFVFADGTLDKQGRWAEVRDLRDSTPEIQVGLKEAPLTTWNANGMCPLTLVLADGRTPYIQDLRYYAGQKAEPQAFRDWVRFYWEHPWNRGELANGGALHRLADMQAWYRGTHPAAPRR